MVKNVNRTARLQWKVDTIKNCIYLQCTTEFTPNFYETDVSFTNSVSTNLRISSTKMNAVIYITST